MCGKVIGRRRSDLLVEYFVHRVSKKSHLWLAVIFDTRGRILICFGRNIANKMSNQKTLYNATSKSCASALPGKTGNTKIAFSLALPEFNQSLFDYSVFLTHD